MSDLNKRVEKILPLMGNQEEFIEMWQGMWDEYVTILNKYEVPLEDAPHTVNMLGFLNNLYANLGDEPEVENENV